MDWAALIQQLIEAGMTQTQIAESCGVAQSSISDLYRGANKSPSFAFGQKLVELADRVKAGAAAAPESAS